MEQKDERQIGYSRACTYIQRGVRNQKAKEYNAPILFSYWYGMYNVDSYFKTSFDYERNGNLCQVCPGSIERSQPVGVYFGDQNLIIDID